MNGIPLTGKDPIPYKTSDITPNLGINDQSDDIRGGIGLESLAELAKFVRAGGTLITEGSTASLMVDYGLANGLSVEHPAELAARSTILRGNIIHHKSPLAYGFEGKDLPVYFNQDPVLALSQGGAGFRRRCFYLWARHHAQRHSRSYFALRRQRRSCRASVSRC